MGTLKILVLCSLFFVLVVFSEETIKTQVKSTNNIDNRCKRETEIDIHAREHKPKVSCHKSTKLLIPITKRFNSINAKPHKPLPRRNLVPVATKPRFLNTTKDEIKQPEVVQTNDSKSNNDTELETIEPNELTQVVNLTTVDNKNKNGASKNEDIKEKRTNDNTDLPTVDEDKQDDKDDKKERKEKKLIGILAETIKTENEEHFKNQTSDAEVNQVPTKEVKMPATNPAKQLTSPNILNQYKVVPGILIQRRSKSSKTGNKPKPVEEKGLESSKLPRSDASTEPLNDINSKTEAKKLGDQIPKMVSLTILTDKGKIPIEPRINPLQAPITTNIAKKETNESTLLPQTYAENQIKITTEKPEHKTSDQSSKTELEEIVIQNNNYEEVYEPSTPQYTTPKLIATELRSAPNLKNPNTILSQYDNNNPQAYEESKPYSYDVTKYPDQYVVNAYEDVPNIRQNFDFPLDSINQDINAKQKYTLNSWPSQSYNQLEAQEAGGSFNLENINQRQEYPRRIWRSWKNNLIYIRPKYGNGVNTELYKGLGRYLANVNPQGAAYNNNYNSIGSSVYENLSTSPYVNRLQYRRYGY